MMAAITAAERGHAVTLLEKNDRLGKKLAITGGGRCNLTYNADSEGLIRHVTGNPAFLYSSFYTFGSEALMDFFEKRRVSLKVENGRVFPKSDRAQDIVEALEKALAKLQVRVLLNHPVTDIRQVFKEADRVIIATGGCSYPATGSTGDGYLWAKELGHTVTELYPSLVPLLVKETHISDLAGLSLREAGLTVTMPETLPEKMLFYGVGELLFTHKGISGPLVLEASRHLVEYIQNKPFVAIDLMPNIDTGQLDKLLLQAIAEGPNKSIGNILGGILPKRLAPFLLEDPEEKANVFNKKARASLVKAIKSFGFTVVGTGGFREAMVTAGGVNVSGINPSDMSSKIVPGLYFAGEVLDVDALTGGFNLQIAFSTGYMAGCLGSVR